MDWCLGPIHFVFSPLWPLSNVERPANGGVAVTTVNVRQLFFEFSAIDSGFGDFFVGNFV